jgi:hypothetical protein
MDRRRIRRIGGLLLMLVWAPIATANALTCGLECALQGQAQEHAHHAGADLLLSTTGKSTPSLSASHFCQAAQPISPTFVVPQFPQPPQVDSNIAPDSPVVPAVTRSIAPDFDTPPPKA